jgi:beta-lactam-binding protein with PASTA domain/serine/threonine protein kinase
MATSRIADQVGRVLGGRYRIIAPVGTGASAQVFLADDVTLRRRVAVKVLHPALATDEAFLRRFRAEAQAAAALNHPHVMAVYDWGEDDGPYLVLEYLGGGSLRGILDTGRLLTPSQALLVGLEAARALDFAHRRGFVHRDIKPANLLFDEEGRLRIADFGLARALAEAAWTEPSGAVLGTARYASPEQVRGERVDGKADVYALALVLVEAVTGEVPFSADTTIATLMSRVDRPLEVPESMGRLGRVLERAGRPEPAERPDAGELAISLLAAAEDLPRPEPLELAGAINHDDETVVIDRDPTIHGGAPVVLYDAEAEPVDPSTLSRRKRRKLTKAKAKTKAKAPRPERMHRRRWPWVALLTVLLLAGAVAGGYALFQAVTPAHAVPKLTGESIDDAREAVEQFGWRIETSEIRRDGTEPGEVVEQAPPPDQELKEGRTLRLTVSLGPTLVAVPDLAFKPFEEAKLLLAERELKVGDVQRQFSEEHAADVVLVFQQGELPKESTVDFVLSDGPEPRKISNWAGKTYEEAAPNFEAAGLVPQRQDVFSDDVDAGKIVGTDPPAGSEVPKGSTVKILVSKGKELIAVPNVAGMSASQAADRLEAAGFRVSDTVGPPNRPVLATDPPAGEKHPRGTKVIIYTRQ